MPTAHDHVGFKSTFNVIGAFGGGQDGRGVVAALDSIGVPPSAITLHRPDEGPDSEEIAELVAEMEDELVKPWRRSKHGRSDEPLPGERDLLVAVHVDDRLLVDRATAVLRRLGAEEVHLVASGGIPLPYQAEHPRPADPDGFWWTHASHG